MTTLSPHRKSAHATGPVRAEQRRLYGLMAEFQTPAAIMEAAKKVRAAGYRWWDCHVPFPVHGLDKAMGVRPTILPWIILCGGLAGSTTAVVLQYFTNVVDFGVLSGWELGVHGYPFQVSGKPLNSLPAFIPVIFELTVLFSAITAVVAMLLLNGLPRLYHPCLKNDRFIRCTDDRFFIVIEASDPKFSRAKTEEFLQSLNPNAVEELDD